MPLAADEEAASIGATGNVFGVFGMEDGMLDSGRVGTCSESDASSSSMSIVGRRRFAFDWADKHISIMI